jgi:hypothetical protein
VGPAVRNRVNLLLDGHLLELQKITPGVVDLRSENVKWYHFVNFATKVVVLCYSLLVLQLSSMLVIKIAFTVYQDRARSAGRATYEHVILMCASYATGRPIDLMLHLTAWIE